MSSWNLVYITSNGHSGSTLLDMLIGSHSACTTLGEIHMLTLNSKGVCACGAPSYRECRFWSDVGARLQAEQAPPLSSLRLHSENNAEFRRMNRALFKVLQEKTGSDWYVDSSKKIDRLKKLLDDPEFNVLPLHIVRRPEGVICSNVIKGRPYLGELRSYYKGLWSRYRYLRGRSYLLVSYESLCSNPERVLSRIMAAMGLQFEPGQLCWTDHQHHNVNGNKRTRTSRQSSIRLDERWRVELSLEQRLVTRMAQICFRLLLLIRLRIWPRPI